MSDTGYSNSDSPSNRPAGPANDASSDNGNIGAYSTILGGLLSAYGKYQAGSYNKKVADFNADYARIQSDQAMAIGHEEQNARDLKERYIEGQTRSGFAAQGVIVGAGTSRAVLDSESAMSAMDKQRIEINARRQAYGFQVRAADETARGNMAMLQGETGAVETLLHTEAQYQLEEDPSYKGSTRRTGN